MIDWYALLRRLITRREETGGYSGGLWPRLVREQAIALTRSLDGPAVELGCGEGLLLAAIVRARPDVRLTGVDRYAAVLDDARARLSALGAVADLRAGDAQATGLQDASFSVCYCVNTLVNLRGIDDAEAVLREARRILAPGGRFIFDIRNAASPLLALQYRFARWYDPTISVPLTAYRSTDIEAALRRTGFDVRRRHLIALPTAFLAPAIIYDCERTA